MSLWGECAYAFDADGLRIESNEEPIIVLFAGVLVSHYSGNAPVFSFFVVSFDGVDMPCGSCLMGAWTRR